MVQALLHRHQVKPAMPRKNINVPWDPAILLLGIILPMQGHMCNVLYKVIHCTIEIVIRKNPHVYQRVTDFIPVNLH